MSAARLINLGATRLAVEEHGCDGHPTVVLVHGLGQSLRDWPDALVQALVGAGFRVVLFDNRDIGRSTRFDAAGPPPLIRMMLAARLKLSWSPRLAYDLGDMAADLLALLDALRHPRVHLVGLSMGGMIAQRAALDRPDRVASLACVMSSSGAPRLAPPHREVARLMTASPSSDPDQAVAEAIRLRVLIAGELNAADRAELVDRVTRSIRYGWPAGGGPARQYAAVLADANRWRLLSELRVPTLVAHGTADPLLPPNHGDDLAARIPGAVLRRIEGLGHEITASRAASVAHLLIDHIEQTATTTGDLK